MDCSIRWCRRPLQIPQSEQRHLARDGGGGIRITKRGAVHQTPETRGPDGNTSRILAGRGLLGMVALMLCGTETAWLVAPAVGHGSSANIVGLKLAV